MIDDVHEVASAMRAGEIVVVLDREDRENEADLVMAAEHADARAASFFVRHTTGILCTPLTREVADSLLLQPMVHANSEPHETAFTVSVDARAGVTTGASASDRSATIRALAAQDARPHWFSRPGHVFPLVARSGGVLERPGHTEAAVDLCLLAGCAPVGLIAELVDDDGEMVRGTDAISFARHHGLRVTRIDELVRHRLSAERPVIRQAETQVPLQGAVFGAFAFQDLIDGENHLALVLGDVRGDEPCLVRLHSECLTGDVFGSARCDCGEQLTRSIEMIIRAGRGVVVYLRGHEGRGIGLVGKLQAYALQDRGMDTADANRALGFPIDARSYTVGATILGDLGVRRIRLLTNNPDKYASLRAAGIGVVERVPVLTPPLPTNVRYLRTKQQKFGHWLPEEHLPSGVGTPASPPSVFNLIATARSLRSAILQRRAHRSRNPRPSDRPSAFARAAQDVDRRCCAGSVPVGSRGTERTPG